MQLFAHGKLCGSLQTNATILPASSYPLRLGGSPFVGAIDELRISRVVRYTTDFERPLSPFTLD